MLTGLNLAEINEFVQDVKKPEYTSPQERLSSVGLKFEDFRASKRTQD